MKFILIAIVAVGSLILIWGGEALGANTIKILLGVIATITILASVFGGNNKG